MTARADGAVPAPRPCPAWCDVRGKHRHGTTPAWDRVGDGDAERTCRRPLGSVPGGTVNGGAPWTVGVDRFDSWDTKYGFELGAEHVTLNEGWLTGEAARALGTLLIAAADTVR